MACLLLQMKIWAEVLIQGYDRIVPFFLLLADDRKRMIGQLVEADISNAKPFHRSQQPPWYAFNKAEKAQKRQDILDPLLRSPTQYPVPAHI